MFFHFTYNIISHRYIFVIILRRRVFVEHKYPLSYCLIWPSFYNNIVIICTLRAEDWHGLSPNGKEVKTSLFHEVHIAFCSVYKICLLVKVNIKLVNNSQSSYQLAWRNFSRVYWRSAVSQNIFPWIAKRWQCEKYTNLNKNWIHWQDSGSNSPLVCDKCLSRMGKWHLYYFQENYFSLPHYKKRSCQEHSILCP